MKKVDKLFAQWDKPDVPFTTGHFFNERLSGLSESNFPPLRLAKFILSLSKDEFCGVIG